MKTSSLHPKTQESSHGSVRSYTLGFILSIIATLIPYYILTEHTVAKQTFLIVAVGTAVVQLFVQLVLFLHLSFKRSSLLNSVLVAYTGIMVLTIIIGTLWVMHNLHKNMGTEHSVYKDNIYSPQQQEY